MTAHAKLEPPVGRGTLMFGALGGAVAWLLHLLAAYLIAEFGCIANLGEVYFLGLTGVAWLILLASFLTLGLALASTAVALVTHRRMGLHEHQDTGADTLGNARYLARAGWITSLLFVLIILAQTIPIFYYLRSC
jgi:hypothetical protein